MGKRTLASSGANARTLVPAASTIIGYRIIKIKMTENTILAQAVLEQPLVEEAYLSM